MKRLPLKEPRAPYTVTLDDETLNDEAMIVSKDGRPLGMLIPIEEYTVYKTWRAERQSRVAGTTLEREKQAYERIKPELLKQYRGRAVAIYGETVVEVSAEGESLPDLAVRVYKRIGYLPIYFQVVEEQPRVYKLPYRKVIR